MGEGFGKASIRNLAASACDGAVAHRSITEALGAIATRVDAYGCDGDGAVDLPAGPEQLCVPIELDAPVQVGSCELGERQIARVPSGTSELLAFGGRGTIAVISANARRDTGSPTVVDLTSCSYPLPSTSDVPTARLTAALGCTGMKVNARRLAPGQAVPYHTEGTQEELFVPLAGAGGMRIAGEEYNTPVGTIVHVAPAVPRSARTVGDEESLWVMVGAPPSGGPDEWDPGATILDESSSR